MRSVPRRGEGVLGPLALLAICGAAAVAQDGSTVSSHAVATRPTAKTSLEDIELLDLEVPTVVTAARHEQKITSVPYAMSVITADDIRQAGARSIPDALRLAPGVDVAQLTYGNWAVSPRGFQGLYTNKTLVLMDGRPIYDPLYAGTAWGNWPFQLEDVARIEVIRGPGGVTWGANAVNGVINIITKDPKDQQGLTVTGGGGSRGTNREHAGYGFNDGKLRLRASGEYEGSDGFTVDRPGILGPLDDHYKAGRAGVHAIYEASPKDTLTLSIGSALIDGNYPVPRLLILDGHRDSAQTNYVLARWNHRIEKDNAIDLSFYFNDSYDAARVAWSEYRYQQLGLQMAHTFKPADDHTFSWGIDTRWDLVNASLADPFLLSRDYVRSGAIGLYAQDDWRFAPRWALNLGGRIDYDFYGGFQPSARAALAYELSDASLVYAAVSRAFQMAPCGRRFIDFPLLGPAFRATEPQDVGAEQLVAYELGYRGRFSNRLEVNANVFWHDYREVATAGFRPGPPGLFQSRGDNNYQTGLYGIELDARYAVTKSLTLLGNYTFEHLDSPGPIVHSDRMSPPRHKFMLGTRYSPLDDLHLSANLYYVDKAQGGTASNPIAKPWYPSYFRLDLRAEYEFWKKQAAVAVGVSNLLDPVHPESGSTAMDSGEVPRMIYAELRVTLK